MIKAVLFDFDDTLVKTKEIRYEALKEAGETFFNLNITDKDIDKHWGKPFNQFISGVFNNLEDAETLTQKYKSIVHKYPNKPFPKTKSVLNKLSRKYLLGIISASNPELILSGLENVGINKETFFFIQSSEDTNIHKPNPQVFIPSLIKLKSKGIGKTEVIYVGDAIDDYSSAVNAGFYFCCIANRTVDESVFTKQNIPYITDFEKLPKYIEELVNGKS